MISMIAVGECAMIHNDKPWIIKPSELPDAPEPCFSLWNGSPAGANKGDTKGISIQATHKAEAEGNLGLHRSCQELKKWRICTVVQRTEVTHQLMNIKIYIQALLLVKKMQLEVNTNVASKEYCIIWFKWGKKYFWYITTWPSFASLHNMRKSWIRCDNCEINHHLNYSVQKKPRCVCWWNMNWSILENFHCTS